MRTSSLKPLGFFQSLLFFSVPTLFLYGATLFFIPWLERWSSLPPVVCWYISGGSLVFLPLFLAALLLYRLEHHSFRISMVLDRFRLNKPGKQVLGISIAGTIAISLLTYIFIEIGKFVDPNFTAQPAFMSLQPLGKGDYWILLAWLPMFFFNIVGEALFWRGYIFPRQEAHFGNTTWMVHGLLWTFFHLPFGWNLMFTLLPILFLTSYLVQITRSTWTDIVIHTIINGTGFLLIAFGIVA